MPIGLDAIDCFGSVAAPQIGVISAEMLHCSDVCFRRKSVIFPFRIEQQGASPSRASSRRPLKGTWPRQR